MRCRHDRRDALVGVPPTSQAQATKILLRRSSRWASCLSARSVDDHGIGETPRNCAATRLPSLLRRPALVAGLQLEQNRNEARTHFASATTARHQPATGIKSLRCFDRAYGKRPDGAGSMTWRSESADQQILERLSGGHVHSQGEPPTPAEPASEFLDDLVAEEVPAGHQHQHAAIDA